MNQESRGIWTWQVVRLIFTVTLPFYLYIWWSMGWSSEAVQSNIKWSGRVSFLLFVTAFAASSIHRWGQNALSWWLFMNRKFIGISFAINHFVHLGFIIIAQQFFRPIFHQAAWTSLVAGGIAYLFITLMFITSFSRPRSWISHSTWSWLHLIGGHWVWAIFLSTYIKRLDEPEHWVYMIILIGVLLMRIWRKLR
jgi:hypothetical protein